MPHWPLPLDLQIYEAAQDRMRGKFQFSLRCIAEGFLGVPRVSGEAGNAGSPDAKRAHTHTHPLPGAGWELHARAPLWGWTGTWRQRQPPARTLETADARSQCTPLAQRPRGITTALHSKVSQPLIQLWGPQVWKGCPSLKDPEQPACHGLFLWGGKPGPRRP